MNIEEGKLYRTNEDTKIGPMEWEDGGWFFVDGKRGCWLPDGKAEDEYTKNKFGNLVSEWFDGPVRNVTRREIVPGTYGRVIIQGVGSKFVDVGFTNDIDGIGVLTADELRSAAMVLSQLAEALDDNKGEGE